MNRDMAQGQWKQLSGKIKQRWGKLTDDDLTRAEGDRDYLVGKVQEQYGIGRDKVEDELQTLGYREDDQDVDLRSSDRSAAGRMDAAGFANAGGSSPREDRDAGQGGNLDREDPSGRSSTDSAPGSNRTAGDERNEEQNPSLRVEGEPQQPGGAGHTLEAGSARGSSGQSNRSSGSQGTDPGAGSRGKQGPGGER
jgi:uncharacterized protein YjbJ (UPF0337 family)